MTTLSMTKWCNDCATVCPGDLISANKERTKTKVLHCKGWTRPQFRNSFRDSITKIKLGKYPRIIDPEITAFELKKYIWG